MLISARELVRHPVGLIGIWLTTVSAVVFLVFFAFEILGYFSNPYLGMVFFLILPGFFVLGLLLVPVGVWLERRAVRHGRAPGAARWPVIDLNEPRRRRLAGFIAAATVVNVLVVSLAAYRGIEYMDSVEFCGQVCHTVMIPEFTAYHESAHARVKCVACHIGPGAPWFVQAKLSGTRQVFAVMLNTYPRPIPSPVENLRPARETCEACHWPEKFVGDRIRTVQVFASDESNTETTMTLRLHVGGAGERNEPHGIHWHVATRMTYVTTERTRQDIPYVRVEHPNGEVREYRVEGVSDADLARGETRVVDCVDCHNRPSHAYALSAEAAIDQRLASGAMPPTLPFVRREAVAAVTAEYPTQAAALDAIGARLRTFYETQYPQVWADERPAVDRAIAAARHAYNRNVFPDMGVGWGTYINNIGHSAFPGCFRCHDDAHVAPDGSRIRQDCALCHEILE